MARLAKRSKRRTWLGSPQTAIIAFVMLGTAVTVPSTALATFVVEPGYGLYKSQLGTEFAGHAFEGVPLGSFDFNDSLGRHPTHNADTIIERLDAAVVGGAGQAAVIDIELVALQLRSVDPIDLGSGLDIHWLTLQSDRGGPASEGNMYVMFDDTTRGTYDTMFDVYIDVRIGAVDGPIISSTVKNMAVLGVVWDRTAPPKAVKIPGVNHFLSGVDTRHDFWFNGPIGVTVILLFKFWITRQCLSPPRHGSVCHCSAA